MLDKNTSNTPHTIVTIGTFDGVHIGHQQIIKRLVNIAKSNNLTPTLLTFFPHPRMVLQTDANIKLINTMREKETLLKSFGIENIVVKAFTKNFSRQSAEEFVTDILIKDLNTKYIIIGYDHRFGKNRSADINDLKQFGKEFNFQVEEISAQDINNVAVSSTKIRKALNEGDIKTANTYLGYNFILSGTVVKGKQLGNTIGFPTANINIEEDYKLIPKQGVYVIKTNYNNQELFGMMNIGTNPTVEGNKQTIEAYFFNFEGSLYDEFLTIEVLHRIRDEQKFESIEALQQQLQKDQNTAQHYIDSLNA